MATVTRMGWDWKSRPSHEDLITALKPFGLFVYEDPSCEGTDGLGYIISNEALTTEQLDAHAVLGYED